MKKNIISGFISIVVLVILGITATYAWYTNIHQTQTIDASTEGIVFSYTINSGSDNSVSYQLSNVSFFDIDNEEEGKYFSSMACMISVGVTNRGSTPIQLTIQQTNIASSNSAYVTCVISSTEIDSSSTTKSVEGFIEEQSLGTEVTIEGVSVAQTANVYVYIYGVQTDDSANNDFLAEKYPFSLSIQANKN